MIYLLYLNNIDLYIGDGKKGFYNFKLIKIFIKNYILIYILKIILLNYII